jgi:hypothetical protein
MANNNGNDTLTQLGEDSNSFTFIEYFLRLSLRASTAKVTSLWEVSNPQLSLQFEKRCKVRNEILNIHLGCVNGRFLDRFEFFKCSK